MRKIRDIKILVSGIILFIISYQLDNEVNFFFKSADFPVFDVIFSSITNFGIVIVIMLLVPIILCKTNKKLICLLVSSFLVSLFVALAIKFIFLRPRPVDPFTFPFTTIVNYSFPSMHAMTVFSLLPILTKYLREQKFFWLGFGLFAVSSRIYLGFHYLSDVVFGAIAGYLIGTTMLKLYGKHHGNNKV